MDDLTTATPPVKRRRLHSIRPPPPPPNLLAALGANQSRMPSSRMERQAAGRELRQTAIVASYAESEDSTPPTSPRSVSSVYETPDTSRMSASLEEHGESDTEEMGDADGPQAADVIHVAQRSAPTKILPYRSTRGKVSFAVPRRKLKTKVVGKHGTKAQRLLKSKTIRSTKALSTSTINTARSLVRQNILERTKPKRDAFILAHSERFLPLLPETNYVGKLELTNSVNSKVSAEYTAIHQPNGIAANLKPYQLEGLSFLVYMYNNGTSAILGDEMGLGKTLQTLALFQYLEEEEQQRQQQQQHTKSTGGELRPHVVICPLSVLSSWMNEARRWTPGLQVLRFHGPKSERDKMKKELSGSGRHLDLIVTTYETFVAEESWFKRAFAWRYVVLDEGHKIKNDKSNVASAIQSLQAEYRLLLTGTPLQNNLLEMWSLLHWLYPEAFTVDTSEKFKRAFNLSQGQVSTRFMDDVRYLLELIMLRRLKSSPGVDLDLPPRQEILLHVPLTPMQRFWYTRLLTKSDNAMLEELFQGAAAKEKKDSDSTDVWAESKQITEQAIASADASSNEWKKLRNLVMQLQKVCSHPYLLKNATPEPYILGDHIMTASGKFIVLDKLVEKLVVQDRKKVLIFSGFTTVLDFCEDLLALKGANTHQASFRYTRLDGGTERAKRNLAIRLFNDPRSDFKIMLISTRAGGLGINLASASDVIFLDEDWNPQVTLQAEARAHRIGQTQAVTVYKISAQGTVEEQMMSRIRKKQYLTAK